MNTLPIEWKAALESSASTEMVKRIEGLIVRGQTAPLPSDKETGPFLLYVLGDSVEQVAQKTGIPVDVVYLTAISYHWSEKREELARKGNVQLITALQKDLINNLLVATQASIIRQVGEVMSGRLPPEKCSLIPRSLHGLKTLMEMVTQINQLVASNETNKPQTVIQAQNVQVNQSITPEGAPQQESQTIEVRRRAFLEKMDKEDGK